MKYFNISDEASWGTDSEETSATKAGSDSHGVAVMACIDKSTCEEGLKYDAHMYSYDAYDMASIDKTTRVESSMYDAHLYSFDVELRSSKRKKKVKLKNAELESKLVPTVNF